MKGNVLLSQKCQYALRAVFELAKHEGKGPIKISYIAKTQAVPQRFLENILNMLKKEGVAVSHRGKDGGYVLNIAPDELTVGDVIRIVQGKIGVVNCHAPSSEDGKCSLNGKCTFLSLWQEATTALESVYNSKTFADLVREDLKLNPVPLSYNI